MSAATMNEPLAVREAPASYLLEAQRVRPGYKQTEVGVIPEDWEVKQIGDLKPFVTSGSRGWAAFYSDRGAPFIRITNLSRGSIYLDLEDLRLVNLPPEASEGNGFKYLTQTARMITTQGLKASSAELIPAHSVVMTSRATIGECAINAVPVSTNQGFKNFVPFETTDGEFLYYLLQTKKQAFISLCGGSTFLEIGKTQLTAFEIELPKEKSEQTAIATILSDMDIEIAALETRLAKTRELKQGMMHNLLTGKIRLV